MQQAGYTPTEPAIYPPYLNIAIDAEAGQVTVTVRSAGQGGVMGATVAIVLPVDQFRTMVKGLDGLL